jgi:opacity protein-like surface antigen
MFAKSKSALLGILFLAGVCAPAAAADLYEPPVVPAPVYQPVQTGGWYIRGDIDYHKPQWRGADYITYGAPGGGGSFDSGELKGGFSLGGGVGYQVTNHFRTDFTADYWFKSKFKGGTACGTCTSAEVSKLSALLLMANAYVDIGTWNGITPYVGAGIGGAHIKWDTVYDPTPGAIERNPGSSNWRFAYALMAGASYCLTNNIDVDVGYRFTHIQGGRMFEFDPTSSGPGFDKGMNVHEVRAGLRYNFGGNNRAGCGEQMAYVPPEPAPVYK